MPTWGRKRDVAVRAGQGASTVRVENGRSRCRATPASAPSVHDDLGGTDQTHDLRRRRLHLSGRGPAAGPPWDARSWSENDKWGWEPAVTDDPGDLYAAWYAAAERSRTTWAKLSDHNGLDVIVEDSDPEWSKKRRRILIDLLEEYLKHTGHADLLREAVDGVRGNDPD